MANMGHTGLSPGIGCPAHTCFIFQCCLGSPAACTQGPLDRTIPNHHSIKAAEIGWLGRGLRKRESSIQPCPSQQLPSLLGPGPVVVPQCDGRRKERSGAQLSFATGCASETGEVSGAAPSCGEGDLTCHQAQTQTLPVRTHNPRGVKHPGRRAHREAFLRDDASFLVPGVRATELQRVPSVTGALGRRGLCKDSEMCFCCHLSSAVGTAQGLLSGEGKPGPVTAPHPEENKNQDVDVPQ